jgi:bifunctional DNase/RNase
MRAVRVVSVIVHARSREPVLVLGEIDGERYLPVFLRQPQAEVIASGPRNEGDPVLTQDLIVEIVRGLGRRLEGVEITELRESIFRAELVFDRGTRIPARPSDALAVAVREGIPIAVDDAILDEVGQRPEEMFPHGLPQHDFPEREVRQFREFIEDVSPDDFGGHP